MKFHLHVGVVEAADEPTLEQALAVARCEDKVLARLAPNIAVLEREDVKAVLGALEKAGLHPRVIT